MLNKIIFLFLFVIFSFNIFGQNNEHPKLIVGIIIDQMRYDQILKYWNKFGDTGFKKLLKEGTSFTNAHYDYLNINSASGIASIANGVYPSEHGIINVKWYNPVTRRDVYCVEDEKVKSLSSMFDKGMSPRNVEALSWTDELRINSYKLSNVYSVSLDDYAAILSGGKLANGAFWFDERKGGWTSSTYYYDSLEVWIKNYNDKKFADTYLSRTWYPTFPVEKYTESLSDACGYETGFNGKHTFPYDLKSLRSQFTGYSLLKYTPFGNTFTKDFAITLMMKKYLGKDDFTDVLMINFAATKYIGEKFGLQSVEIEDAYVKLDKDIAHLISVVEDYVGKGNVLFFLTSDRGACNNSKWMNDINIQTGIFNPIRANVVLNTYLRAVYGIGNWVDGFHNNELYLDHTTIDKNQKSLRDMQDKSVDILSGITGISTVIATSEIKNGSFSDGIIQKAKNSFFQGRSGDVYIVLDYGWKFKNMQDNLSDCCSPYNENTHVPVIFYGKNIKKQTIYNRISMNDIAVTLSFMLGIPLPSKSTGNPIQQLLN